MYPLVLNDTQDNELFETELARVILAAGIPCLLDTLSAAIIDYLEKYKDKITSPVSKDRWAYVIDFYWSNIKPKIPHDYDEAVSLIP